MKYEELNGSSREETEKALNSGDENFISTALIEAALNDSDWRWVQGLCARFADSSSVQVRRAVATCLGHIARIHHNLDSNVALPILRKLLGDPTTFGSADDAMDDISTFLGWEREQAA